MTKLIYFCISWTDRGNKIEAIKLIRSATECGLKDAKDAVEDCEGVSKPWFMSPEQFGLFAVKSFSDFSFPFDIQNVKLVERDLDVINWVTKTLNRS